MNKRAVFILILLALPIIGLAAWQLKSAPAEDNSLIVSQEPIKPGAITVQPLDMPKTDGTGKPPAQPRSLEEARIRLRQRLAALEQMSPEEWEHEQEARIQAKQRARDKLLQGGDDQAKDAQPSKDDIKSSLPELGPKF